MASKKRKGKAPAKPRRSKPRFTPPERPSAKLAAHRVTDAELGVPQAPGDCSKCGASEEEREDNACYLEGCPFDLPKGWSKHWRGDRGQWENVCPHGVGHPARESMKNEGDGIHGCDGCCSLLPKPPPEAP